jgi:cation diffusion facilitator family transporter
MAEGSKKAILAAFFANLGIAVAKLIGFLLTGAASMLAESIHSLADTGNQGLLLLGAKRAKRPPDERHPFGHSAERYFWAFVVALVLFSLGSLFAIYEGIGKLLHPHSLDSPVIAVGILGLAILLEGFSLRTAAVEASHDKHKDESYWAFIRRTKTPELPVVLLEDVGALCGLVLALAGVGLAEVTGNPRWDATGSIAIGVLLGVIAVILAVEMKSLLIGEAADPTVVERLKAAMLEGDEVSSLIHLRTLQLGPDDVLVAAKVDLAGEPGEAEIARAIDRVESRMRVAVPNARLIFLEPDVART